MRAALEIVVRKPGLLQHASGDLDVNLLPGMRCTSKSDLLFVETERIGRSARDQRRRLEGFAGGTKESDGFRVADLDQHSAVTVDRDDVTTMKRLDSFAANDFCKDRGFHLSIRRGEHRTCILASGVRYRFTGQHPSDLFDALSRVQFADRNDRLSDYEILFYKEMMVRL
jgi:hypothetical protein